MPNALLRRFFERPGPGLLGLSRSQFDATKAGLHAVFDVACDTGIAALLEAARRDGDAELTGTSQPQVPLPSDHCTWCGAKK